MNFSLFFSDVSHEKYPVAFGNCYETNIFLLLLLYTLMNSLIKSSSWTKKNKNSLSMIASCISWSRCKIYWFMFVWIVAWIKWKRVTPRIVNKSSVWFSTFDSFRWPRLIKMIYHWSSMKWILVGGGGIIGNGKLSLSPSCESSLSSPSGDIRDDQWENENEMKDLIRLNNFFHCAIFKLCCVACHFDLF